MTWSEFKEQFPFEGYRPYLRAKVKQKESLVMLLYVLIRQECIPYEGCETTIVGIYDEYVKASEAKRTLDVNGYRQYGGNVDYEIETFELNR